MTDKDLKRLRRDELLEMLIAQSRKIEELQTELDAVRARLSSRDILIQEAGSIAEAAVRINGVFEAAQAAAEQYLENVRRMSGPLPEEASGAAAGTEAEPGADEAPAEEPEAESDAPQSAPAKRGRDRKGNK